MSLQVVNFGLNQYCGPAVLSALTGESTDRCAAVISAVSGKTVIKAVQREHLRDALKRLRFDVEETNFSGSTLYGVLYRMHHNDGQYVIFIPNHVIAIEVNGDEIFICDNHTKTPLDIKQSSRLTQRVELVWKVQAKAPPKFIENAIELILHSNRIDIKSWDRYENPEDDTRYGLGY